MKKILGTINVHSFIDIITNSSTEIFVRNIEKTRQEIDDVVRLIQKEFGCTAVEFSVEGVWDEETDVESDTVFNIWYDYEMHHPPCKMMEKRLKEVLGIND